MGIAPPLRPLGPACRIKASRVGKAKRAHAVRVRSQHRVGFAEPVIGPATSGRTRWLSPPYLETTLRAADIPDIAELPSVPRQILKDIPRPPNSAGRDD